MKAIMEVQDSIPLNSQLGKPISDIFTNLYGVWIPDFHTSCPWTTNLDLS